MKYCLNSLRKDFEKGIKNDFLFFWGHQPSKDGKIGMSCLSQWWTVEFQVDNLKFYSAEQYMMAEKAKLFNDMDIFKKILMSTSPKEVKQLGRQVKNFNEDVWKKERYKIVKKGNMAKFSQNVELKNYLLSTENKVLVEASPYDRIWGIGLDKKDQRVQNPLLWQGENLLGFALIEVRDILEK